MNLLEILKSNGIGDDVINKITDEMRANKIYTASEENLDIRYGKLKKDHTESQNTIADLQSQIADFEKLKLENTTIVTDANNKIAELKNELVKVKTDKALERALIEANVQDVDYLKYKLKERFTRNDK